MAQATYQYKVTVLPENATNKTVQWAVMNSTNVADFPDFASDASNITGNATITQAGVLTPIAAGLIKVIAKSSDGSNIVADLDVTITSRPILVESITFDADNPSVVYLDPVE